MADPKRTPEESRRRKAVFGWIPSVVIVAVLAAGAAITAIVSNQAIGEPRTIPPAVGANGYSIFDDEGLRFISDERTVWVDLRETPIEAADLQLPANDTLTFGPRVGVDFFLGVYGNDTPVKVAVDSIDIKTNAGVLTSITAKALVSGGFAEAQDALGEAAAYGLGDAEVQAFLDDARVLNRRGEAYERTLTGDAVGRPVDVVIACSADQICVVDYVVRVS